jgi:hypothetical protein
MADRGWTTSWSIISGSVTVSADIRVTKALHFQGAIEMLEYSSSKQWVLRRSFLKEFSSSTRNRHLAQGTVSSTEKFVHWMKWIWSHLQVNSDRWQGRVHRTVWTPTGLWPYPLSHSPRDFKFPPRRRWELRCSGSLRNLSVISSSWPLKMGPIGFPETSARNYHYSLRNDPEERCSLLVSFSFWSSRS